MSVPAIAIYASAPGGLCFAPDFDLAPRPPPPPQPHSASGGAAVAGGLSCLFSSPAGPRHASSLSSPSYSGRDEPDELGSSYSYTSLKCRNPSPVSVFHSPVFYGGSSRSPPLARASREWREWRARRDRLFNGFIRNALGSCLDYAPQSPKSVGEGRLDVEELPFELDENLVEIERFCDPYTKKMLVEAQSRHKIFHEELVVKAFYEAETAHRGQVITSHLSLYESFLSFYRYVETKKDKKFLF